MWKKDFRQEESFNGKQKSIENINVDSSSSCLHPFFLCPSMFTVKLLMDHGYCKQIQALEIPSDQNKNHIACWHVESNGKYWSKCQSRTCFVLSVLFRRLPCCLPLFRTIWKSPTHLLNWGLKATQKHIIVPSSVRRVLLLKECFLHTSEFFQNDLSSIHVSYFPFLQRKINQPLARKYKSSIPQYLSS